MTIPYQGLSLSRSRGREEERPWERGCDKGSWFDQPSQIGEEKPGDEQCSTASESVVVISKKKMMGTNLPEERKVSFLDHMYLRHLSTEYRSILSADMSTDSRSICRPSIGRYVGRVSVDMLFELIDCRSTLSVGMSVDTRPTSRPICRWCIGRLSVVSEYC